MLAGEESSPVVKVEAAKEKLLIVKAKSSLELIRASYHLGNRHVELEIHTNELLLLEDQVLAKMLTSRGLFIESSFKEFFPEPGAYSHHLSH